MELIRVTKLMHLSASPRGAESESLALAEVFLDELAQRRPDVAVETWDLWDGSLPEFGPAAAGAKMAIFGGEQPTGDQVAAWSRAKATFERFDAANCYVFSVPMWNHGVPYVLKQLIDVISQPGMVFSFDAETGYTGLLRGKRAIVIYTSAVYGESRPPAFGSDFQRPYLDDWLHWAGVTDTRSVTFRPNLVVADADEARERARVELVKLAAEM